ncbi:hypothetical protein LguiB_018358 [Lonicera macranthoides]
MCELLLSIGALNNETLFLSKPNTIQLPHGEIDQIEAAPMPASVAVSKSSLGSNDMKDKTINLFKNNRAAILVAATVIASRAFYAGLNPLDVIWDILDYLVSLNQFVVRLKNENSFIALDMIEQIPRDSQTTKMLELLVSTATLNNETPFLSKPNPIQLACGEIDQIEATLVPVSLVVSKSSLRGYDIKDKTVNLFKNNKAAILIAATVIASKAFQAGLNPPNVIWDVNKS